MTSSHEPVLVDATAASVAAEIGGVPGPHYPATRVGDAFGQAVRRCWANGARFGISFEVLEREDGCIYAFDAGGYFAPPEKWPQCERTVLDHVRGRVLDLGCGPGRHLAPLTSEGVDAVGIDISPGALAICRERDLPALERSVDQLTGLGTFDTILLLGNNVGLLRDRDHARHLLNLFASHARPGCVLLCSSIDPMAAQAEENQAYRRWNEQRGRLPGQQRTRVRDRMLVTPWFDYLFVSPDGLAELLPGTPWSVVDIEPAGPTFTARLRLGD